MHVAENIPCDLNLCIPTCVIVGVSPYSCYAEAKFSTYFLCLGVTQMPKCRDPCR